MTYDTEDLLTECTLAELQFDPEMEGLVDLTPMISETGKMFVRVRVTAEVEPDSPSYTAIAKAVAEALQPLAPRLSRSTNARRPKPRARRRKLRASS